MRRLLERNKLEEGVDRCEPRIACTEGIAALGLEVLQESGDQRRIERREGKCGRRLSHTLLCEHEKQSECVAIRGYGIGARIELTLEAVGEERFEKAADEGHGLTCEKRSSRAVAASRSSGTAVRYQ